MYFLKNSPLIWLSKSCDNRSSNIRKGYKNNSVAVFVLLELKFSPVYINFYSKKKVVNPICLKVSPPK